MSCHWCRYDCPCRPTKLKPCKPTKLKTKPPKPPKPPHSAKNPCDWCERERSKPDNYDTVLILGRFLRQVAKEAFPPHLPVHKSRKAIAAETKRRTEARLWLAEYMPLAYEKLKEGME